MSQLKEIIRELDKKFCTYSLYKDANNVYHELLKSHSKIFTTDEILKSVENFYGLDKGIIPFKLKEQ